MSMISKHILPLVLLILVSFTHVANAQDAAFTQFYANPLYLNPAMAGSANCPRISMNHRNQWPSLKSAFITNSISYDRNIESLHGGLGLQIFNDIQGEGALSNTQVNLIYSYQLQVSKKLTILSGIQASYQQRALDKTKLFFGDQIDPNYGFVFPTQENVALFADNISYTDISLGLMAFTKKYFFGMALHHITEPEDAFISTSYLPKRLTIHTGANFAVGNARSMGLIMDDGPFITPNLLYMSQNGAPQLNLGLSLTNQSFSGGLYFRNNFTNSDAVLVVLGYESNGIRLGYSYDYTISELMGSSGGAHEVSLTIQMACRPKRKKLKAIKCPKF
jgi:type IX secretion system PorP/SprF family membrane protein